MTTIDECVRDAELPKRACIAGATGYIGSAITGAFLDAGIDVVAPSHSMQTDALPEPDDAALYVEPCRYTESEGEVEELVRSYPNMDTLVYCGGSFIGHKPLGEFTLAEYDEKMRANLRGFHNLFSAMSDGMRERQYGNVVGIGSKVVDEEKPGLGLVSLAKAGVQRYVQEIATDYSVHGITANAIAPSIVDTPKERDIFPEGETEYWLPVEAVANEVLDLCMEPRYKNGNVIEMYKPNPAFLTSHVKSLEERGVDTGAMQRLVTYRDEPLE